MSDFTLELLTVPPGFERGIDFRKSEGHNSKTFEINIQDLIEKERDFTGR